MIVSALLQPCYNCCIVFCCWQQAICNIHLATMFPATLLPCCWQQSCLVDGGLHTPANIVAANKSYHVLAMRFIRSPFVFQEVEQKKLPSVWCAFKPSRS